MIRIKISVIIFLIITLSTHVSSQSNKDSKIIYIETEAKFQGRGIDKFLTFIMTEKFKWPETAKDEIFDGKVYAQFCIDSSGTLTDIKIIRSLRKDFDEEVIRALEQSPKWLPATQNNRPVSQCFVLPFIFRTDEETIKELQKKRKNK